MNNSNKYKFNGWNNKNFYGSKKKTSIDKNKINYLKKLKKQNVRKESYKKINFKIYKIFNEMNGNKNDVSFFSNYDKYKLSDFI